MLFPNPKPQTPNPLLCPKWPTKAPSRNLKLRVKLNQLVRRHVAKGHVVIKESFPLHSRFQSIQFVGLLPEMMVEGLNREIRSQQKQARIEQKPTISDNPAAAQVELPRRQKANGPFVSPDPKGCFGQEFEVWVVPDHLQKRRLCVM